MLCACCSAHEEPLNATGVSTGMWISPRKLNVSGLPCPAARRWAAAKRSNAMRRVDRTAHRTGLGIFPELSKADTNPNVHDYSYQVGLGGKGLFAPRPDDRFGLGYYRFAFSRVLRDAHRPPLPNSPEGGIEAFYNYQIVPGLNATVDLQWVDPARNDRRSSVFAGLRIVMRF